MNFTNAIAGMTPDEVVFEINRGARFIVYQYCFSIVIVSFKRSTSVQFVKVGESAVVKGLPWTALSAVFGWWGIPWGFIYTPQVLYKNLKGGVDVTPLVLAQLQRPSPPPPPPPPPPPLAR
jgi:hypothetical protein